MLFCSFNNYDFFAKKTRKTMKLIEITSKINVWDNWVNAYKKYVPKFIEEATSKTTWQEWDVDVFKEYFEKSNDQCVSSLRQGYFTKEEQFKIKENWNEIAPLLKAIAENQKTPQWDIYEALKKAIRKYTKNDMRSATNRLIAGLQPQLLSTIVKEKSLRELYDYLQETIKENLPNYQHDWFKDSYSIAQLFKESHPSENFMDLISYPWQVYEYSRNLTQTNIMNKEEIQKYTNLLSAKKQIILQGPPGTGKTRLAKQVAEEISGTLFDKELNQEQVEIIQFHPSYTYEDFVRGITLKNDEDGKIEYRTENKVLASIAERALKNYTDHKKEVTVLNKEAKLDVYFNLFIDTIELELEKNDSHLNLTDNVAIVNIDEDAFRYKGKADGWVKNGNRMLFKDIKQAFLDDNKERQDIKKNPNVSGLAKQHASYFIRVLNKFQKFIEEENLLFNELSIEKEPLKNYVLIIDEINRANLSSVLGELIYALEYRGEAVESMYEMEDGSRKITLPDNLYIIGTMNTADRSVGQIDYAIRRRFAFIDVLPEDLTGKLNGLEFATTSFNKVEEIFDNHVSSEFEKKDVQLGHSYFIHKKEADFSIQKDYEIKPILHEYIKDGILEDKDNLKEKIAAI